MSKHFILLILIFLVSCTDNEVFVQQVIEQVVQEDLAKITNVVCTGQPNNYTFNVTIESPDTGCDQYADWWEVFTLDGTLAYRRILTHSHVDEQPFTRSGGTVKVGPDDSLYVRAHMNNLGYGTQVFSGTVRVGLELDSLATTYADSIEILEPLPTGCAF